MIESSVRTHLSLDPSLKPLTFAPQPITIEMALRNKTFTIVEMERDCSEDYKKVFYQFMTTTIPTLDKEFIKDQADKRVHDGKPYLLDAVNHVTKEAFIAYVGKSKSDTTTLFCLNNKIRMNGSLIMLDKSSNKPVERQTMV